MRSITSHFVLNKYIARAVSKGYPPVTYKNALLNRFVGKRCRPLCYSQLWFICQFCSVVHIPCITLHTKVPKLIVLSCLRYLPRSPNRNYIWLQLQRSHCKNWKFLHYSRNSISYSDVFIILLVMRGCGNLQNFNVVLKLRQPKMGAKILSKSFCLEYVWNQYL